MKRELNLLILLLSQLPLGGCWDAACSYLAAGDGLPLCSAQSNLSATALTCDPVTTINSPSLQIGDQFGQSVSFNKSGMIIVGSPGGNDGKYHGFNLSYIRQFKSLTGDGRTLTVDQNTGETFIGAVSTKMYTTNNGIDTICREGASSQGFAFTAVAAGSLFIGDPLANTNGAIYSASLPCMNQPLGSPLVNPSGSGALFGYSLAASQTYLAALGVNAWVSPQKGISWSPLPAPPNCNFLPISNLNMVSRPAQYLSMTDEVLLISCTTANTTAPNAVRSYVFTGTAWMPGPTSPNLDERLNGATKISLAQQERVAIIGAPASGTGQAWALRWDADNKKWGDPVPLIPSVAASSSYGNSVAVGAGGTLLAVGDPSNGPGVVHVFSCKL